VYVSLSSFENMNLHSILLYWIIAALLHSTSNRIIMVAPQDELKTAVVYDTFGKEFIIYDSVKNNRLNIFIFLSPECPACIKYTLRLRDISSLYAAKGVTFYGIIPGDIFSQKVISDYIAQNQFSFNIYIDKKYMLTNVFKCTITPQAIMTDSIGNILYSGMIDDWFYKPGKNKRHTSVFYLMDNIESFSKENKIIHSDNEPIGCYIFR
jgi:thiol-disulfide isomerase/thioredoxin